MSSTTRHIGFGSLLATIVFTGLATLSARAADVVSLAGQWRFQLDRRDAGLAERWFARTLDGRVELPGSLAVQRIGDLVTPETEWTAADHGKTTDWHNSPRYAPYRRPDNVKVPFFLQPERVYVGPAWYQRDVAIPEDWAGKQIVLSLERPHISTEAWLDDRPLGRCDSLATAHVYELGSGATTGKHVLTLRVDNRDHIGVGNNSHSISDHTQGNWNGVVGRIELRAHDRVWIREQRVYPKNDGTVRVELTLHNAAAGPIGGNVFVTITDKQSGKVVGRGQSKFDIPTGLTPEGKDIWYPTFDASVTIKLDEEPKLWSEFSPALYTAESRVEITNPKYSDTAVATFGFREIGTQGTQFVLNGRKIFFRGTLECCVFPRTGHPPTDVAEWKRIIGVAKAHGLNLFRFHSWCPPEAAFQAADELGFYLHVECSSWCQALGIGRPIDAWLYAEGDRILAAYGNHPSFVLMLYGNEPGGRNHKTYLAKWVDAFKAKDPRRLYSSASGWPQIAQNQFHDTPEPRVMQWQQGQASRVNRLPPETVTDYRAYIQARNVPVISHEIGQWCAYPNFDEIPKYTGHLKPKNFEIFHDFLNANHMGDQARAFLYASGKLQTICYKEDIESALRTPGMGGFELLDLHDFPGQGTALVGVLDPFWESKGYITAAEYRRFCNSTVPLARLAKRVFTTDETLKANLEVAHFGPVPLRNVATYWRLVGDDGKPAAEGKLPARDIPFDNGVALGRVSIALRDVPAPRRYKLVVGLEGTPFENDWDVWVYPAKVDLDVPAGVLVTEQLDGRAADALARGGRVVWTVPPRLVRKPAEGPIAMGFSSIFWNTLWTMRQVPHTLGILCDPKHPLFAAFPTDGFSNWQWWYLIARGAPLLLDGLPAELRPTVQIIDDWYTSHRIGLVIEAKLGSGRLLVTSIDLANKSDADPVTRQFRHSLLRYAASDRFAPEVELTLDQARSLIQGP